MRKVISSCAFCIKMLKLFLEILPMYWLDREGLFPKVPLNETAQETCFILDNCTLSWRKTRNVQEAGTQYMSEMMLKHFASFLWDLCTSQARKLLKHKGNWRNGHFFFLSCSPVCVATEKKETQTKQNAEGNLCLSIPCYPTSFYRPHICSHPAVKITR